MTACANCGGSASARYCPECGQRQLQRLTLGNLVDWFPEQVIDRGLWPTLVAMFIRPGHVSRQYNAGHRRSYLNPVSYYLIGAGAQVVALWFNGHIIREQVTLAWEAQGLLERLGAQGVADPAMWAWERYVLFIQNAYTWMGFFTLVLPFALATWLLLKKTRVGLIIQAAITHPNTVANLGHNVPLVFMGVFGVGSALAGLAGVIAGPALGTFPGMAFVLGSIVFVVIVVGGLGSLAGAFVASLLIGWLQTFAIALDYSMTDLLDLLGISFSDDHLLRDLWSLSLPQVAPILPYLLLILILIFRPTGLMGKRET